MSGTISFNPFSTSVATGSVLNPTQGYVQGIAMDDPSVRMELMGGTLASTETLTMWGGVPISEEINNLANGSEGLGPTLKRATSQANVTGWSVFNQAGSMVITGNNGVPQASVGNFVAFYRNVTNARITVQCDPALIAALSAAEFIYAPALYWDVTNYRITLTTSGGNFALPASVRLLSTQTNSKIVTYTSASSVTWGTGDAALILI